MTGRLAKSLAMLRDQADALAPQRSRASDGWIGDAAHSARKSDHNPNGKGVVCAIDITHDPRHGLDANALAETLRASKDPRLKYIIWNRRIWNPSVSAAWRPYTGSNPHDKHVHVSVAAAAALYDDARPWALKGDFRPDTTAPKVVEKPLLKRGSKGDAVKALQKALGFTGKDLDGDFGKKTEGAVIAFQKAKKLVVDGRVGPATWDALAA